VLNLNFVDEENLLWRRDPTIGCISAKLVDTLHQCRVIQKRYKMCYKFERTVETELNFQAKMEMTTSNQFSLIIFITYYIIMYVFLCFYWILQMNIHTFFLKVQAFMFWWVLIHVAYWVHILKPHFIYELVEFGLTLICTHW